MTSNMAKPKPRDLSHHLGRVSRARKPSNIKDFYKYMMIPGIGNMAGGMPNNNYFPFDTLEGAAALPERWQPTPNKPVDPPLRIAKGSDPATAAAQVVVPKESGEQDRMREIDVKTALQYGTAQGYPPLYGFVRQFTRDNLHPNVPYKGGPEIVLTNGSTDGYSKVVEAFTTPWFPGRDPVAEREGLLCEKFIYSQGIQTVLPRGLNIVPVEIDNQGMVTKGKGGLQDVLENWDFGRGKRPHLMYTVTIGQNPTSGTLSVQRRKEIYALCVKYDILIVEDDPYWYLQFPSAAASEASARGNDGADQSGPVTLNYNSPKSSGYEFLDSLVPSYLSIDVEGRVIRLDTFSKTVAPGCRLGWITAQPAIIEQLLLVTESATQQPSGYVQSMVAQLLLGSEGTSPPLSKDLKEQDGWKTAGWVRWLEGLRGEYERRMNTMCQILDEGRDLVKTGRRPSLDRALASTTLADESNGGADNDDAGWSVVTSVPMYDFQWPRAGMFVWVEVNLHSHPLSKKVEMEKLARALWVYLTTEPHLVLVAPGSLFSANEDIAHESGWKYFRICFAPMPTDEVAKLSHRFVNGVRAFWRVKDVDEIERLASESTGLEAVQLTTAGFC